MKEEKIMLKNTQRQQLIAPKGIDIIVVNQPVDLPNCTSRNICNSENTSIGGAEDILF